MLDAFSLVTFKILLFGKGRNNLNIEVFFKTLWKKEKNAVDQHFSFSHYIVNTLILKISIFWFMFVLFSANAFSSDESRILVV